MASCVFGVNSNDLEGMGLLSGKMYDERDQLVDGLGVALSIGCLLHCLLLPVIIPVVPYLSSLAGEQVHIALACVLFALAVYACFRGYRLHKRGFVLWLGLVGIAFLFSAVAFNTDAVGGDHATSALNLLSTEAMLTSIGGVMLIGAHLSNLRLCRCLGNTCRC